MRRVPGSIVVVPILAAFCGGCASSQGVRYVYQDGDYGVVGLPENTDRWPTRYRHQAEALMTSHFPEGHAVVRAEEVVEGSRTLKIEGTHTAEVSTQIPAALLNAVKLGRTASRSQADSLKVKECRIIYKRIGRSEASERFAPAPSLAPTMYIDPNIAERIKTNGPPSIEAPGSKSEPKLAIEAS